MRIGFPEMLVIVAILLLVFGANRLPELGRSLGKAIRGFKDATKDHRQGCKVQGAGRAGPFVIRQSSLVNPQCLSGRSPVPGAGIPFRSGPARRPRAA